MLLNRLFGFTVAAAMLLLTRVDAAESTFPAPKLTNTAGFGRNIQRTMRLLATSTPEQRHTVRILFYGQSITEQRWARLVTDDLRSRFPNANLVVENRALGGFASQMLVNTAEGDLYPFYPDLVIFHVYGAHDKYEDIIRRIRERTTAEILQQNDHVTKASDLTEETNPEKLPPLGKHWDAFMNQNWLPVLSRKYGTELCDQRNIWKQYLRENSLEPKQLLRDNVHLNAHGEFLMAECVKAYLRYDPKLGPSTAEQWVRTLSVGRDVRWSNGVLRVEFDGNRADVIGQAASRKPFNVIVDGANPSTRAELYTFTRALAKPGGKWPVIAPITSRTPLLIEDWTLDATRDAAKSNAFTFTLRGSKTGADGEGRSDLTFVSKSGRVAIETNAWNVSYALALAGVKTVPERFTVKWSTTPLFKDEFTVPAITNAAIETVTTVAQGLTNSRHVLEIRGEDTNALKAVRVYTPPLRRS